MLPKIEKLKYANSDNFFLLAGPCVIEDEKMAFPIAERIIEITENLSIPFIFKASFKKANRSRLDSFTGIGDELALKIMGQISEKYNIPVVTDIHTADDAKTGLHNMLTYFKYLLFLSRQTDLLIAAAKTGRWVNIKKDSFCQVNRCSMQLIRLLIAVITM